MSKLSELIAELCPNGVEYRLIGNICETITDYTAAGSFADIAKNVQYINNGKGYAQLIRTTDLKAQFENDDRFVYVDEHAFNYLWRVNLDKEGLVLPNVGNCGEVYYVTPDIFPEKNNVLGPNAIWLRSETVLNRYLYHVLLAGEFQTKLAKIVSPTGQTKFNKTNFKELTIPVPPLAVQCEIVRILDSFTALTAELTAELSAELAARKQQYAYYANKLFTETDAKRVELSEIARFVYGYTDTAKDVGDTRFIRITDINDQGYLRDDDKKYITRTVSAEKSLLHKGDIIMARTGATYGKTLYFDSDFPSVYASFLIKIIPDKRLLSKYYWHFTKTSLYWDQANKLVTTGGQPQFNTPALKKIQIPLPNIATQQRVVDTLDQLDQLCCSLSAGIPAEIAARQKQYEYYRDKLLSLPVLTCQ